MLERMIGFNRKLFELHRFFMTGNTDKLKRNQESPSKGRVSTRGKNEPLTGMVMYNGAMVDIDSVLDRLKKGETSLADFEKKVHELTQEKGLYLTLTHIYKCCSRRIILETPFK